MTRQELKTAESDARRERWRGLVEEARTCGYGPTRFCRERGIDVHQFYYWRRTLALEEGATPGRFALVGRDVAVSSSSDCERLELETDDGWRLRIPRGVDEPTLRVVIGALRQGA